MPNGYIDKASLSGVEETKGRKKRKKREKRSEREEEQAQSLSPPRSLSFLWSLSFRICRTRRHICSFRVLLVRKRDSEIERKREREKERKKRWIEPGSAEFTPADCVSTRFLCQAATKRRGA